MVLNARKAVRLNGIEAENTIRYDQLGGGEQIKARGGSKGGWQSVKRDEKSRSVRWTGIARQALLPGETPMRALSSSYRLLRGARAS